MALLTPLSLTQARALASRFGVFLTEVEPLLAGSVNSNFRFTADTRKLYFARVYEEQGFEGARTEVDLLTTLHGRGVPVVCPLPTTDGTGVIDSAGKPFAMFPWVEGDWLCLGRVTAEHCRLLGAALAQVHLSSSAVQRLPEGRFTPAELLRRLEQVEASGRSELAPYLAQIRGEYEFYLPRRRPLPLGICHGDLFRDNVLWSDGKIAALLDFESAAWGSNTYDLMVTALAWCFLDSFQVDNVRALFAGYTELRPLSGEEWASLEVEGALACLRFATTRITDFELRARPGATPARDFRRFLERLRALKAGAFDDVRSHFRP